MTYRDTSTSGQYSYGSEKMYAQAGSDYSKLGTYNTVQGRFSPGAPIMSETKIHIVPSFGSVGYLPPSAPSSGGGTYFALNDAYCCGQNTCQSVAQPLYGNVVKNIYGK